MLGFGWMSCGSSTPRAGDPLGGEAALAFTSPFIADGGLLAGIGGGGGGGGGAGPDGGSASGGGGGGGGRGRSVSDDPSRLSRAGMSPMDGGGGGGEGGGGIGPATITDEMYGGLGMPFVSAGGGGGGGSDSRFIVPIAPSDDWCDMRLLLGAGPICGALGECIIGLRDTTMELLEIRAEDTLRQPQHEKQKIKISCFQAPQAKLNTRNGTRSIGANRSARFLVAVLLSRNAVSRADLVNTAVIRGSIVTQEAPGVAESGVQMSSAAASGCGGSSCPARNDWGRPAGGDIELAAAAAACDAAAGAAGAAVAAAASRQCKAAAGTAGSRRRKAVAAATCRLACDHFSQSER